MGEKKPDEEQDATPCQMVVGWIALGVLILAVIQVVSWLDGGDEQPAETTANVETVTKATAAKKATKTATAKTAESRSSQDEKAVANFNRYVRRRGPDFPWDDLLVDVYITGALTSTLNVEIRGTSAEAAPLCVLIEQWIVDVGGRWVSKAKVRRPVDRGHAVMAEC